MPALLSAWIALISLILALVMLLYRPAFTDLNVTLVLYFGSPGAMCLAGLVLWAYRKERAPDVGRDSQRLQAKVAIALAIAAAAIVYGLVIGSEKIEPIDTASTPLYNAGDVIRSRLCLKSGAGVPAGQDGCLWPVNLRHRGRSYLPAQRPELLSGTEAGAICNNSPAQRPELLGILEE